MPDFSELLGKLSQTWPARVGRSFYDAMTLPGDVYQGNIAMTGEDGHTNPQVINRAADLAGMVTGGSYAAPAMKDAAGMGIRAYHGSPHDFNAFDMSKIGTGEGAQAYGHGLYFAGNEKVAQGYRDALARDMYYTPSGEMFDPQSQLQHLNVRVAARNNGPDLDATIARANELLPKAGDQTRPMIENDIATLQRFKDAGGISKNPGHMYEVDINADPDHFLDWDKPLTQQHPVVKQAVQNAMGPNWDQFKYANAGDAVKQGLIAPGGEASTTAAKLSGIPGIKYLDQGSRAAGDGSRNYVVFNDKLIDIARKYGLAAAMGGGGMADFAAGLGRQDQTQ